MNREIHGYNKLNNQTIDELMTTIKVKDEHILWFIEILYKSQNEGNVI